ncbi:MAG: FHA domain-containing protein [Sandaracinaceae bacterium]|nr:FHA domain-containing protein [Sandaracinaceae bacterium]
MSELRTFVRYEGRAIELGDKLVLGRASSSDIVLEDERASRHHCAIQREGDRAVLVDLDSRNGVRVNGARVSGSIELHHGDLIEVGACRLVVLRQAVHPRQQHASRGRTQPEGDDEQAWRAVCEELLRIAEAASQDELRAEVATRNVFVFVRARAAHGSIDPPLFARVIERGFERAERGGDPYWLDQILALHLVARMPITETAAERIRNHAQASETPTTALDDYLAASGRVGGVSGRARAHLSATYCLREARLEQGSPREQERILDAREALRTVLLERIAEADRAQASPAPDPWTVLAQRDWSLVDHFDHAGRRYLVACKSAPGGGAEHLTPQELRVAPRLARGASNKEIAYELDLSVPRVANMVSSIKTKLGVASRSEAVMLLRWTLPLAEQAQARG